MITPNPIQQIRFTIKWAVANALCWAIALPICQLVVSSTMFQLFGFMGLFRCTPIRAIPEYPLLFLNSFCLQSWYVVCMLLSGTLIGSLIGFTQGYLLDRWRGDSVKWRNANIDGILLGFLFTYPAILLSQLVGAEPLHTMNYWQFGSAGAIFETCTLSLVVGEILSSFLESRRLKSYFKHGGSWVWTNILIFLLSAFLSIQLFLFFVDWFEITIRIRQYWHASLLVTGLLSGLLVGTLQGYYLSRFTFPDSVS